MRANRTSLTAALVALARAVYSRAPRALRVAPDPVAPDLLPGPLGPAARVLAAAWRAPRATHALLTWGSFGLAPHVALRTAAIDDALRAAVARGVRQVVILGAGLDARAWRLDELAPCVVFEVDHPATQGYKRARVEGRAPAAREVRFVPVDFERDLLDGALARADHDASAPTFWIWEGVTMYLRLAAIEATLAQVAARSAPGSAIAITYVMPDLFTPVAGVRRTLRFSARAIGEPLHGAMTREAMAARLAAAGFAVRADETTTDWAARYWPAAYARRVAARERLVTAERTG
jgi:methyltransferase (TIGR00027 family)